VISAIDVEVRMRKWSHSLPVAFFAVLGLGVAPTRAGFTKINKPWAGEASQQQVLTHVFGGTFTASGVNFSSGSVTATRVDDSTAGLWTTGIDSVTAIGRFTRNSETFGVLPGATGGTFKPLFTVTGRGFNVSGSFTNTGSNVLPPGTTYRLARSGGDGLASSLPADNGGVDHLVSYVISGSAITKPTFMMFFEDNSGGKADFDFNDLVVKVTSPGVAAPASSTAAVPLPSTLLLGASGLAVLAIGGAIRRWRQEAAAN
jgi:hypothetical protein